MRWAEHQGRRRVPWVGCVESVVGQDLCGASTPSHLDRAAEMCVRHAVQPTFEADQRIDTNAPCVHDAEQLRQRRQQAPLDLPGLPHRLARLRAALAPAQSIGASAAGGVSTRRRARTAGDGNARRQ